MSIKNRGMKKGQFTLVGLIMIVISLIVLGALMPTIVETIEAVQNETTPTTDVIIGLVPMMLVLAIIMGILFYAVPRRESEQM